MVIRILFVKAPHGLSFIIRDRVAETGHRKDSLSCVRVLFDLIKKIDDHRVRY